MYVCSDVLVHFINYCVDATIGRMSVISLILQLFASFISFTAVVMSFFAFFRFRKIFFLHTSSFFTAFFLISLNTSLYHFFYITEMHIVSSPLFNLFLGSLIAFFFTSGLIFLVMDLIKISPSSKFRIIPWIYVFICIAANSVLSFFLSTDTQIFLQNVLGIWIPSFAALILALVFHKRYVSGIFKQEKKMVFILASVTIVFYIAALFFPSLSMLLPFIAILCFCILALSVSFRHFFMNPHLKSGQEIPPDLIVRYALTPREREIISSLLEGKTNKELSDELFVSLKTIETHLGNIYRKTGVKNRLELFSLLKN